MSNYMGMDFEAAQEKEKNEYFISKNDQWISVKDRLPLYKECILFYSKKTDVTFGCYRGEDENDIKWFIDYNGFRYEYEDVTHWMPLPEPPK